MNNTIKHPSLDVMQRNAEKAETLLKHIANAKRLLILCNIVSGEKSVGELAEIVGLSQSAISQHLAKMRDAELITAEKRGQMVYYRISSMEAQALLSVLYLIYCKE
ncbi:MAG: metalloregulator ArsR/SmtB family transcription factor [Pseudomonadota bacterium]